jgi:hypothetical protein
LWELTEELTEIRATLLAHRTQLVAARTVYAFRHLDRGKRFLIGSFASPALEEPIAELIVVA